jgi:hypothetical protein
MDNADIIATRHATASQAGENGLGKTKPWEAPITFPKPPDSQNLG